MSYLSPVYCILEDNMINMSFCRNMFNVLFCKNILIIVVEFMPQLWEKSLCHEIPDSPPSNLMVIKKQGPFLGLVRKRKDLFGSYF